MKAFFHELRRRRVTRTAIVYALVAWGVIEASSVIFPALHLPEWTVTFVVVLALLGFPVVLIFSWMFDVTRAGVVRTPSRERLPPDKQKPVSRGRWIDFAIIAVLLGVIGWLGWERIFDRAIPPAVAGLDSIAVLPFANLTGDPADEYFSDGLAEELLNALVEAGIEQAPGSVDPEQLRNLHAMLLMHRGQPEAFFERLEQILGQAAFSWGMLMTNPVFEPVREDPRFLAEVQRLREGLDEVRAEVDEMDMPGK